MTFESSISFGMALKAARRGVYQFPREWRVLVACQTQQQLEYAFDEARRTLEAGSLPVEGINWNTRIIYTDRGGQFWFRKVETLDDAYMCAGMIFPHVVWLHEPTIPVRQYVNTFRRFQNDQIDDSSTREDLCTL